MLWSSGFLVSLVPGEVVITSFKPAPILQIKLQMVLISGAQLELTVIPVYDLSADLDRKELRQLWEEETISYNCENKTLVRFFGPSTIAETRAPKMTFLHCNKCD